MRHQQKADDQTVGCKKWDFIEKEFINCQGHIRVTLPYRLRDFDGILSYHWGRRPDCLALKHRNAGTPYFHGCFHVLDSKRAILNQI